jgi:hypothetical protein
MRSFQLFRDTLISRPIRSSAQFWPIQGQAPYGSHLEQRLALQFRSTDAPPQSMPVVLWRVSLWRVGARWFLEQASENISHIFLAERVLLPSILSAIHHSGLFGHTLGMVGHPYDRHIISSGACSFV